MCVCIYNEISSVCKPSHVACQSWTFKDTAHHLSLRRKHGASGDNMASLRNLSLGCRKLRRAKTELQLVSASTSCAIIRKDDLKVGTARPRLIGHRIARHILSLCLMDPLHCIAAPEKGASIICARANYSGPSRLGSGRGHVVTMADSSHGLYWATFHYRLHEQ